MSAPANSEPRELGYFAGLRGADPRECPFEKMTREWNEWQRWHGFGVALITA